MGVGKSQRGLWVVSKAQTPQQRAANAKFAKSEAAKRGKPQSAIKQKQDFKSPISKGWIIVLLFVLGGGAIFELARLFIDF
ncbi:uncharacterized protein BDZ99DRAFT_570836 [Mytilinidion resinicola]|uniref:Stress-associated endoplasmic reticulum protein n=1 Tax=Mytilinidion resinicola TaxID=574789 RepID=A0A6A6YQE3_9PEZI|nr:uncharacterized protein BDZ99DRAFT_570836 [Mytilinidion resinicola]KAF2810234.1 hypothetical protein BDZ99DRAFT_570836 [Mytilinidion resinicola]